MSSEERRRRLLEGLRDEEYRRAFVPEHVSTGIAFQIRRLRDKHGWTQEELAARTGKAQETVSQLENPDYGRYTLATLKKLAAAFDVALLVRFVPFGDLLPWTTDLTPQRLAPQSYEEELSESRNLDAHWYEGLSLRLNSNIIWNISAGAGTLFDANSTGSGGLAGQRITGIAADVIVSDAWKALFDYAVPDDPHRQSQRPPRRHADRPNEDAGGRQLALAG